MPFKKSSNPKPEETKKIAKEAPKAEAPALTPDQAMVVAALNAGVAD